MKLVRFTRRDNGKSVYINPDTVALVADNDGYARIITLATNGNSSIYHTVDITPDQAVSLLEG